MLLQAIFLPGSQQLHVAVRPYSPSAVSRNEKTCASIGHDIEERDLSVIDRGYDARYIGVARPGYAGDDDLMSILIIFVIISPSRHSAVEKKSMVETVEAQGLIPVCTAVNVFPESSFDNSAEWAQGIAPDHGKHANILALHFLSCNLIKVDFAAVFTQLVLPQSVLTRRVSRV
jgi:hypothetical protein